MLTNTFNQSVFIEVKMLPIFTLINFKITLSHFVKLLSLPSTFNIELFMSFFGVSWSQVGPLSLT